jgi:ATP-binding cassette subfamily B protein
VLPRDGFIVINPDMTKIKEENPKVLGRLIREARPYWFVILVIFLLELLATPLAVLVPVPVKIVVDSVLGSENVPDIIAFFLPSKILHSGQALLVFAVVLQILIVLLVQLQYLVGYVLETYAGGKLILNFREKLFNHVQRLSFMFHDARGTSDSIYRIQYDTLSIQNVIVYGAIPLISSSFKLIAMIYVITLINLKLMLVAISVLPIMFVLTQTFNKVMRRKYHDIKKIESSVLNIVQEVLTAARVVKAFGGEERENERFVGQSDQMIKKRIWLSGAESFFGLTINLATALGTAAILYIGVKNVQSGQLSLGELLMVITYLSMMYGPLKSISKEIANLQSSIASAQRVYELLDEVPDVVDKPNAVHISRVKGEVNYKHISFTYDRKTLVLKNIDFFIPVGAKVGIAGKTGAGKTTLLSLLPRFYDPSEGSILIDGIDIRDYKLQDLRNQFSIVLQDPLLFSTTIKENIAYARHGASEEEIIDAAVAANAHDFIMELPEKYDTLVGERGMRLSGGERQRISLARAFLKDAPILLLDEPTSSVDTKTEKIIMEAMNRLMSNRTTFMIAHRLTTLEKCDIIFEIKDGELYISRK